MSFCSLMTQLLLQQDFMTQDEHNLWLAAKKLVVKEDKNNQLNSMYNWTRNHCSVNM